jgi:hypothetical protein
MDRPVRVQWADGTPVGIPGDIEETLARHRAYEAEEARKAELRDSGVVLLEDYR